MDGGDMVGTKVTARIDYLISREMAQLRRDEMVWWGVVGAIISFGTIGMWLVGGPTIAVATLIGMGLATCGYMLGDLIHGE